MAWPGVRHGVEAGGGITEDGAAFDRVQAVLGNSRHNSAGTWPGQVCDTVSELAAGITEEGGWPELLPFMFQCVQSGQPRVVEAALLVFAQLARYLADTLRQYLGTLHGVRAAAAPLPYYTPDHAIRQPYWKCSCCSDSGSHTWPCHALALLGVLLLLQHPVTHLAKPRCSPVAVLHDERRSVRTNDISSSSS